MPPIDLTKYHGKGLTGIENLGNTCFLNACMQVLSHTYELNEFLDSEMCVFKLKPDSEDSTILTEWNDLRRVMWSGNGTVNPQRFVHNVHRIAQIKKKDIFTGFAQNDMPEFLLFMTSCMHTSISRRVNMRITGEIKHDTDKIATKCYEMLQSTYLKEYSEIMDIFYGIYVTEIRTIDGATSHVIKPESYFILDLPVIYGGHAVANIYESLDIFTTPEYLDGDNAWFNENTGVKEDIIKQTMFWNFPKILVITLNRFTPDGLSKINNLIEFPLDDLDLSKYVRGYNSKSFVYELYGVCNHSGGILGGHYTATVKTSDNHWFNFNDNFVTTIENPTQIITPLAYCLFYRKKNNVV